MKRVGLIAIVVVGVWWWRSSDEPAPSKMQVAVIDDGFLAFTPSRDVVELDRDAREQHRVRLAVDGDVRLVGTRAGTAVAWQDKRKLKLAIVDADGHPGDPSTWGKNVKQLCDGVASNEYRFGVGWLEADGGVWFVHGPMARTLSATSVEPPVKSSWCGIASAAENVALLWRDGGRLLMNFCTAKKCTSLVVKVPIDGKDTLLGYGCVTDACLFAARDKQGNTKLVRVTERGKTIVKPLENVADAAISVTGAGTRAFAVSYRGNDNRATIRRVALDGTLTHVWHFADDGTAAITWAGGKLLVAFADKQYALDMPR